MPSKTKGVAYATIVTEAEAAVAAVKDPELRRVAFDKILTTLLEAETGGAAASGTKRTTRRPSADATDKPARSSRSHRQGPKAYIEELIVDGYFKKQRTIAEVKAELANRGHHVALTSLSGPLQSLTQDRKLRRQKVAANSKGTKTAYAYSNW